MENKCGAFRKKKVYFSQVSNSALRDSKLSLKAKGLYALIQSYISVENFTLYKSTLKKQGSEGDMAFESAWKELKDKGYLIQYRLQGNRGCFYYEYELLDVADIELATKIDGTQNRKIYNENIHTHKSGGMDKNEENHTLKTGGVDITPNGKMGAYNNTNLNNTDLNNTNTSSSNRLSLELIKKFENNICKLKKTTKSKFLNYCNKCNSDLIIAISEYSGETNIKSFAGFETIIEFALSKNITTGAEFIDSVKTYRANKKKKTVEPNKEKTLKFNNFQGREYDYVSLERKLLGWDK